MLSIQQVLKLFQSSCFFPHTIFCLNQDFLQSVVISTTRPKPFYDSHWSQKKYNIDTASRTISIWTLHIPAFLSCFPPPLCSLVFEQTGIISTYYSLSAYFGKGLLKKLFLIPGIPFPPHFIPTFLGDPRSNA